MATTIARSDIEELVQRYAEAWNAHDLDAIMGFHPEDATFCQHVNGDVAEGKDAVREAFAQALSQWPDLHFASRRLLVAEDFLVHEMTCAATANGDRLVSIDMVDVITLDGGLVQTKDTYIDSAALAHQLAA